MIERNVVVACFPDGERKTTAASLWQYDYGQILKFDLDLPQAYEVHFANAEGGNSVTQIGDADGVAIPDALLLTGKVVYAWVFLHTGNDDGETEYKVTIPVNKRPKPTNATPTPVQQDAITEAIAALQVAVTQTAEDAAAAAQSKQDASDSAAAALRSEQNAAASENNAAGSAAAALQSKQDAGDSAAAALQSERNAAASAASAYNDAERAEQAAGQSGYMFFYINDDGDLIYQRTQNVSVDFYLNDGDLFVKAVQ